MMKLEKREGRRIRYGVLFIAAFLAGAAALMWTWNILGHDLLGGSKADFRHGVAAAAAYVLLRGLFRSRWHETVQHVPGEQQRQREVSP
jgi:H+/Cl- antiporter ClcA